MSRDLALTDDHQLATPSAKASVVPAIVAAGGDKAMRRYLEFFAVTIDNPNTRAAYFHACRRFFAWCDPREDIEELADIEPMHVAAYIRGLGKEFEKPTVSNTSRRSACCRLLVTATLSRPIRRIRCAGQNTSSRPARPRC